MLHKTLIIGISFLLSSLPIAVKASNNVLILCSSRCNHYPEVVREFSSYIEDKQEPINIERLDILKPRELPASVSLKVKDADLILAIDEKMARLAHSIDNTKPIVIALSMPGKHFTNFDVYAGVSLAPDLYDHFKKLKSILPEARQVGILYSSNFNEAAIEKVKKKCKPLGLKPVAIKINEAKELPAALNRILAKSDVLIGVPDPLVLSRKTAKAILLASFRQHIPFVGISPEWVKAGALYSLDPDMSEVGHQNAELALDILSGAKKFESRIENPRKLGYSVNLRTAKHMKIELADSIISAANKKYE